MAFRAKTSYDKKNKIWSGPNSYPIFHPDISVGQTVLHMLNLVPNKIVQINDATGQRLTGNEMRLLSIRGAQNLKRLGYEEGDIIGSVASNTHYLAPLLFSAFLNGNPINTLDPSFNKAEIKHMFGIIKPKVVFCDAKIYKNVSESLSEIACKCPIYLINGYIEGVPSIEEIFKETGEENDFIPPNLIKGGDHIAAIFCSSGTTGLSKGVCITHRSINVQMQSVLSSDTIILCFSSIYWLSGLVLLLLGTLCGGTRIITEELFSPELMLHLIEKYKVTVIMAAPSHMAFITQCPNIKTTDLSSIRIFMCGGSIVPIVVANKFEQYLKNGKVIVIYGMTELAGPICAFYEDLRRPGSVGNITSGVKIKITDENGKKLGVGERGEICIMPPFKFLGYYKNEKATRETLYTDGWIHSGDLGYMDEDGYLFIVDRKKEILKYRGYSYFPNEIEGVILEIPDVVEVCVFGRPDVEGTSSDLPTAAIVKREGSPLSEADVCSYVAERMVNFKHLKGGVEFVKSLPKTPSGKILRRKVTEMLRNGERIAMQM